MRNFGQVMVVPLPTSLLNSIAHVRNGVSENAFDMPLGSVRGVGLFGKDTYRNTDVIFWVWIWPHDEVIESSFWSNELLK